MFSGTASALRVRDYRMLWTGQIISHVGTGVTLVALAFQALQLTDSPGGLGLVLTARSVPMLALILIGGAITDRMPRRAIMLLSDAIRGASVLGMALLAGFDVIELWHLIALAVLFGIGDAFFFPAVGAIVPELVSGKDLVSANSMDAASRPLAMRLAGPALGGVLVATTGTAIAFAVDAATFLVSALFLLKIPARPAPPRAVHSSVLRDIVEGFRYVRSRAWIWATLLMALLAVLFFIGPSEVLLPKLAKVRMDGATSYGWLLAAMGAGGILGAIAAPLFSSGPRMRTLYISWGAGVFFFAGIAFVHELLPGLLLMAGLGFCFEIGHILWITQMQELVPPRLLGRVRSLDFLVSLTLMPLSYAIVAPVSAWIGIAETIFAGGVLAGVATFAFMLYPGVLDPDRPNYRDPDDLLPASRRSSTWSEPGG